MDEGEESGGELVIAHGDTAELLEFEEECLHKMAFLVQPPIDVPRVGDIRRRRERGPSNASPESLDEYIRVTSRARSKFSVKR